MRQLTRVELDKMKKLEMLEEFDPSILLKTRQFLNTEISKGIITQQDYDEFWPKESGSFTPVLVTENDLTKNLRLIRPQQVMFDKATIQKSIGEREGYYMNTLRNRELDIVGMPWGYDIIKGKRAEIGEIRHWGGIPYRKVTSTGNPNKDWQRVKDMAKKPGAKGGEKHEEVKAEKEYSNIDEFMKDNPHMHTTYVHTASIEKQSDGSYITKDKDGNTLQKIHPENKELPKIKEVVRLKQAESKPTPKKKELTIKSTEQEVYDYFEALKGKKVSIGSGSYLRSGSISNVEILNGDKISNTGVFVNFLEDGDDSPEKIKVNFSDKDKFTVKSEKKEEPKTTDNPKSFKITLDSGLNKREISIEEIDGEFLPVMFESYKGDRSKVHSAELTYHKDFDSAKKQAQAFAEQLKKIGYK